jgi:hypothetical protein
MIIYNLYVNNDKVYSSSQIKNILKFADAVKKASEIKISEHGIETSYIKLKY